MKKYISIFCVALLIISALSITAERLSIHANVTDTYVTVDKTATAYEITCGQEILVNLIVTGTELGGPVDVMLVIDRSGSMMDGPLDAAKAAAKSFIDKLSFTGDPATSDWVGIVSYATTASLDQGLTGDPAIAKLAIDGLSAWGWTNIMAGVHIAQEELAVHGRAHTMNVMIVLSDGVANRWTDFETGTTYVTETWPTTHTTSTLKAIDEATAAKDAGTTVFTIGLNLAALSAHGSEWVARDTLKQMATSLDYFFDAATPGYLEEIYGIIATYITPAVTNLTLTDVVEDEFVIVGGSIDPTPTSVVGNTITWEFDTLGSETKTFQYKIRPIRGLEGWYPTNVEATLTYTDHEGNPASLSFPIPEVELYRVCISAIELNKTANPTVINKGEKVVYTYEVTNPGPYPLHDVNVTDDQYGTIAGPFDLEVGETTTFTYETYPTADITNWAEAKGKDPWNYTVSDEDNATVSVIAECTVVFFTDPVGSNFNITFEGETYVNGDSDKFGYGTSGEAYADCPPGYVFDHWEIIGNVELSPNANANPVTFTIKCGGDLKAVFIPAECTVNFYTDPSDIGSITFEGEIYFNGDTDTFTYGTSGLATANVPDGWVFYHWEATGNVDLSSTTTNPTTVTVLCGGTLKAVFTQIECLVDFYTDPSSVGSITFEGEIYFDGDSDTFPYGTSGLATANVPEGWMFDRWEATGNVELSSTTDNPTTVTVLCGGTLKAVFIEEQGTGEFGTIGYWKHVFYVWKTGKGTFKDYVEEILVDYLERINATSTVFSENYTLTMESAYDLLWSNPGSNMRRKALRQCLACWLNWADGTVTSSQMVDIDYDGHPDMTFGDAMTIVENILRNPHSSLEELEHAKNICDSINNM